MKALLYGVALPVFALIALVAFMEESYFFGALFTVASLGLLAELGGLRFLALLGLFWWLGE